MWIAFPAANFFLLGLLHFSLVFLSIVMSLFFSPDGPRAPLFFFSALELVARRRFLRASLTFLGSGGLFDSGILAVFFSSHYQWT